MRSSQIKEKELVLGKLIEDVSIKLSEKVKRQQGQEPRTVSK